MIFYCRDQITDDLLAIIADKNWKIRNEGLQKVMEILKEAKFITANIGGLPASLKARIGDVNKNLVCRFLKCFYTISRFLFHLYISYIYTSTCIFLNIDVFYADMTV